MGGRLGLAGITETRVFLNWGSSWIGARAEPFKFIWSSWNSKTLVEI